MGGSFSIFTRTSSEWKIASVKPAGSGSTVYEPQLLSSELTNIGVVASTQYPFSADEAFQVGFPGGPFSTVSETLREESGSGDGLHGASSDFTHVVFASTDHALLSVEPTGTDANAHDLYEWSGGGEEPKCGLMTSSCKLVNVMGEGAGAKVIGRCGATLGSGLLFSGTIGGKGLAHNAVSADGSKIFFTAPDPGGKGEGCYIAGPEHERGPNALCLYMRVTETVEGDEESRTVNLSAPESEGMHLSKSEEEMPVYYQAATADGSKAFFFTERALTKDAVGNDAHLYEYDSEAEKGERLRLIYQGSNGSESEMNKRAVFPSKDGSVVYFYRNDYGGLYRFEEGGSSQQIASLSLPEGNEMPYSTPDGEYFTFVSQGVVGEQRGTGITRSIATITPTGA